MQSPRPVAPCKRRSAGHDLLNSLAFRKTIAPIKQLSTVVEHDGRRNDLDSVGGADLAACLAEQIQMYSLDATIGLLLNSIDDGSCFHAGISQRRVELDDSEVSVRYALPQVSQRRNIGSPRPAAKMVKQIAGNDEQ